MRVRARLRARRAKVRVRSEGERRFTIDASKISSSENAASSVNLTIASVTNSCEGWVGWLEVVRMAMGVLFLCEYSRIVDYHSGTEVSCIVVQ